MSTQDLERFIKQEKLRQERFKALDRMREAFEDVTAEKVEREIAKALANVRKEKRARNKE